MNYALGPAGTTQHQTGFKFHRHFWLTTLSVLLLTGTAYASESLDDNRARLDSHEIAVAQMAINPDKAELVLREAKTPTEMVDYALFLHAFRSNTTERNETIRSILTQVNDAAIDQIDNYALEALGHGVPYDGTDESIITTLQIASSAGVIETHPAFYAIPCHVLFNRPGLLDATAPVFGGNRDNFLPRSGCAHGRGELKGFPDEEVDRFIKQATCCDGKFIDSYGGTMQFYHAADQAKSRESLKFFVLPESRKAASISEQDAEIRIPYATWSYLSLHNRRAFMELKGIFITARESLTKFYQEAKGLDKDRSKKVATDGLFNAVFGANCGGRKLYPSLRKMLIDRSKASDIKLFLDKEGYRDSASLEPFYTCARYAGIEPLIHIAVQDSNTLSLLLEFDKSLNIPDEERTKFDLHLDVNTRNEFNKTPLMTASQYDFVESVRLLLKNGADVNSRTNSAETWSVDLDHDQRTALIYAAASGSLEVMELLIRNGADRTLEDSQGLRPIDYLTGNGPVPENTKLTHKEMERARALLE